MKQYTILMLALFFIVTLTNVHADTVVLLDNHTAGGNEDQVAGLNAFTSATSILQPMQVSTLVLSGTNLTVSLLWQNSSLNSTNIVNMTIVGLDSSAEPNASLQLCNVLISGQQWANVIGYKNFSCQMTQDVPAGTWVLPVFIVPSVPSTFYKLSAAVDNTATWHGLPTYGRMDSDAIYNNVGTMTIAAHFTTRAALFSFWAVTAAIERETVSMDSVRINPIKPLNNEDIGAFTQSTYENTSTSVSYQYLWYKNGVLNKTAGDISGVGAANQTGNSTYYLNLTTASLTLYTACDSSQPCGDFTVDKVNSVGGNPSYYQIRNDVSGRFSLGNWTSPSTFVQDCYNRNYSQTTYSFQGFGGGYFCVRRPGNESWLVRIENESTGISASPLLSFSLWNESIVQSYTYPSGNESPIKTNITQQIYASDNWTIQARGYAVDSTGRPIFSNWLNDTQTVYDPAIEMCNVATNFTHQVVNMSYYDQVSLSPITLSNSYSLQFASPYSGNISGQFTGAISDLLCTNINLSQKGVAYNIYGTFLLEKAGYTTIIYENTQSNPYVVSTLPPTYLNFFMIDDGNTSTTTFTIKDFLSKETLQNVNVEMYLLQNSTYTLVYSKLSDITGQVSVDYIPNKQYRFVLTRTAYNDLTFDLNPIQSASYDIFMTKAVLINNTLNYDRISLATAPQLFYGNQSNTFVFSIYSPYGELTSYAYSLTYPGGSSNGSGFNPGGETLTSIFTMTGAQQFDLLRLDYNYNTDVTGLRQFTYYYEIILPPGNHTFIANRDNLYGLKIFERFFIAVLVALIIAGIGALIGQAIPGVLLSLFSFGYMVAIGFIPIWGILVTIVVAVILLSARSE